MIAEGVLAIEMGATVKWDPVLTIHPHPTIVGNRMESSRIVLRTLSHIYKPVKH